MRPRRTRGLGLALALFLAAGTPSAAAQAEPASELTPDEPRPFLAPRWGLRSSSFWWPSVILERNGGRFSGTRTLDETRLGLALAYRHGVLGPHIRVAMSPNVENYQNLVAMAGAGFRAHFELLGLPLSYGVGAHIETRLRDSLWLVYATPIELGAPIYRGGSAEFHAFVGARRAMHGQLINSFLLDPNGFDNENSQDELDRLRYERPWQVFVTFAFGRRIE